ncbi:MAG: PIN domain-containing protein [Pseudonocardia sp.]|nr:PIN domain-containing protein [Pseudonocardia sp.]
MRFLDLVQASPRVSVVGVDAETVERAWRWLRQHDERGYSFVDATSFVLMRGRRIREALAFDDDFTAAGFVELRP